jgi:hypothetical protein
LAGKSGAAEDCTGGGVSEVAEEGRIAVSWTATEVGSTEEVASVDVDVDVDVGTGAGVADETGAWCTSTVVEGTTSVVETTDVAMLLAFSDVEVEYGKPVWST